MTRLEEFKQYQAQTTPFPIGMDVDKAEGCYIYDKEGRRYLDLVAGVSANVVGHSHPKVVSAIKDQVDRYMHVMVYGEFIHDASLDYCKLLVENLPDNLETVYLVNSGTEAIEGSLKLAKRITGRGEIIAAKHAYHGNTQGSMSVLGVEEQKQAFRPLIPNVKFIEFNNKLQLEEITENTAAVILESIQGGAGFILPENDYLKAVRKRCDETGAQLIFDEIQPGFGRTGKLFGFEHYGISPDILAIGKAMGGGLPVGAFVASREKMELLQQKPMLGHITTFGGNPVIAASCLATLEVLLEGNLIEETLEKEKLFRKHLVHPCIKEVRGKGLMLAPMFERNTTSVKLMKRLLDKGLITFLLLFEKRALRLSPPLTISEEQIIEACKVIRETLDEMQNEDDL